MEGSEFVYLLNEGEVLRGEKNQGQVLMHGEQCFCSKHTKRYLTLVEELKF